MARILEHAILIALLGPRIERPRVRRRKRSHKHLRIIQRVAVLDSVPLTCESLDEAHRLAGAGVIMHVVNSAERTSVSRDDILDRVLEVGGLDDKGIALPPATRV